MCSASSSVRCVLLQQLVEIDGLAAAVARANLGPDVLASAAAWLATAGASSVTQLETDDIDGALY
jgi:hypothetical protein